MRKLDGHIFSWASETIGCVWGSDWLVVMGSCETDFLRGSSSSWGFEAGLGPGGGRGLPGLSFTSFWGAEGSLPKVVQVADGAGTACSVGGRPGRGWGEGCVGVSSIPGGKREDADGGHGGMWQSPGLIIWCLLGLTSKGILRQLQQKSHT